MKSLRHKSGAFTIIELLVSMSIVMILLVVLFQMVGQTSSIWKYTNAKAEQFRGARTAFEAITRQLSQATLNTYWDYDRDAQQNIKSTKYVRNPNSDSSVDPHRICSPVPRPKAAMRSFFRHRWVLSRIAKTTVGSITS